MGNPQHSLEDFNTATLSRYFHFYSCKGSPPRPVSGHFHPLRGLGVFLQKTELLVSSPFRAVTMPKKDGAIRRTISDEEVQTLIGAGERPRYPKERAPCVSNLMEVNAPSEFPSKCICVVLLIATLPAAHDRR